MNAPSGLGPDAGAPAGPRRRASAAALAGLLAAAAPAPASAAATAWVGDAHAAVRLVTAAEGRGAGALDVGVEFRFAPGWHGYWRTPGDAGVSPSIDWANTTDLDGVDLAWPAPSRLVVSGLQNAVYAGTVLLPARVAFRGPPGAATALRAAVDYAACSDVCVPFHADLALDLAAGAATPSIEAPLIAAGRAAVPGSPADAGLLVRRNEIAGSGADRRLVVALESPAVRLRRPDAFVEGFGDGLPPAPAVAIGDDGRTATLTVPLPAGDVRTASRLRLTLVDGARSATVAGPEIPPAAAGEAAGGGLLAALLSAVLGGLVLNLMPCVLPVLSLKLAGLAGQAGAGRRAMRLGFAATALGIVASFVLLAVVLAGLAASGQAVGWGIQFQQPLFLAAMALVTTGFAASLFDWLHVGAPANLAGLEPGRARPAWMRSFLTGALATLLATPCSAPFVGTAAGFALSRGPVEIVAVFSCLGLGMALPFIGAALAPGVAAWLPRPGRWMVALRRALGLLLIGTAAWLVLVLSAVAGPGAAGAVAIAAAALLCFLGWSARAVPFDRRGRPGLVALAFAAATAAVAVLPPRGADAAAGGSAAAFDPDAIAPVVARGGTVLVDVSAAWCLTCRVNEAAALDSAGVRGHMARSGTVVMRADWTRPDPGVSRYLKSFDRYGIPLDVVYGPGRPDGEALPEILTPGIVEAALDRAAGPP